jgi:hypothetical protein
LLNTGLGDVYAAVKASVNVAHAEGFDRYRENEEYAHEAGTCTPWWRCNYAQ